MQQGESSAFIKTLDDGYALLDGVVAACDVRTFEQALSKGRQLKQQAPPDAAAQYELALQVYTGELFSEPIFAAAFEAERDGYKRQALDAAFWLADNAGSIGDATGRGQWLARATQIAPSDEEVYVRLMQHHRGVWPARPRAPGLLGLPQGAQARAGDRAQLGLRRDLPRAVLSPLALIRPRQLPGPFLCVGSGNRYFIYSILTE